jgi:TRAP-type C4-dicarboxylate transport system permease small subunit
MCAMINRFNLMLGFTAGSCIVIGAAMIITEILFRVFAHRSLQLTDEYSGYLMAVSSMLGLGYVEMKNLHIRMDLIDLLKSRCQKFVSAMKVITYLIAIIFSIYLIYVGWNMFYQSFVNHSRSTQISETLLAIPQFFVLAGAVGLFLQYLCNLCKFCAGGE